MFRREAPKLSPAKEIAYIAVTSALLICVQLALSAVPGVECVTVLLLSTSYVFGARFGFFTGLTFSLLRCLIFGFYLSVVLLYCIYFPLFGIVSGLCGKLRSERLPLALKICTNIALLGVAAAAFIAAGADLIKVSRIYKTALTVLLWLTGGLCCLATITFDAVWLYEKKMKTGGEKILKLLFITSVAVICTIFFTLLDDVITPLVIGMTYEGALTYFFVSFTAMLPQTVCTLVTVSTLFMPLTAVLRKVS